MYNGRYMSCSKPSVLYSLAFVSGMNGQIQLSVTPEGSATRAVPPGAAAAVEDADAEVDELALVELDPLLHAAMPTASSAAAPATTTRARRDRRLFRNINCAPWLCCCAP